MGRPTISNPNSKNLTIRISEELSNQLEKYCEEKKLQKVKSSDWKLKWS